MPEPEPSGVKGALRRVVSAPVYDRAVLARERWRTRSPHTFNEKVRYKILRDRRPIIGTFADKVAVRAYVAGHTEACELTERYAVTDDLGTVDWERVPREFVVKAAHTSGGVVVVWDGADPDARLPAPGRGFPRVGVRPEHADRDALHRLTRHWVEQRFDGGPYQEWAYSQVRPRLVVEEVLRGADGRLPLDYKLWTFHGVCRVVEVALGGVGERRELLFTPGWDLIVERPDDPALAASVQRPRRFDRMLRAAADLGAETDFVRVDLYEVGDRVVFGELTNYPDAGRVPFDDPANDVRLGAWWEVPRRYR